MPKLRTVVDLLRAIDRAPEDIVREVLKSIACSAFVDSDDKLDRNKDLGADFIGDVVTVLVEAGFAPDNTR